MRRSPLVSVVAVAGIVAAAAGFRLCELDAADAAVSPAARADIPAPYLAAYEQAARTVQPVLPWEILAGVGEAATDHGRRSPYDGVDRSRAPAADYPVVDPPIAGAGSGPLLLTPAADIPAGADPQDVVTAATILARAAAPVEERVWHQLGLSSDVVDEPLDDPDAVRFWSAVVDQLPVAGSPVAADTGPVIATSADASASTAAGEPAGDPMARFAADLLVNLGDQVTPPAVAGLSAWASGEGSTATFNPFDTTEPEPGSTAFNSNGGDPVRNYPDYRTGLEATVATLEPGGRPAPDYAAILDALRQGTSAADIDAAVAASPWGTHQFPNPTFSALANFPGLPGSVPTGPTIVAATPPPAADAPTPPSAMSAALDAAQRYAGLTPTDAPGGAGPGPVAAAGTGAAAQAVAAAMTQLGKPYVSGGTGPNGFDCSGLVQWAYRMAGVALPRTTYEQVGAGQPVSFGDPAALQPGDLLFIMGSDPEGGLPGHVGMLVADDEVIEAPYTGAVVRLTPLSGWLSQLVAVRRVVGESG